MRPKTLLSLLVLGIIAGAFGQNAIELTFTAKYNGQYVPSDSILIENLTQGGDTMLYAPDTVLALEYNTGVGINPHINAGNFSISQNRPNPFREQTMISVFLREPDQLQVSVTNLHGQRIAFFEKSLNAGKHSFVFYPGGDSYCILSATVNGITKSIKMINLDPGSGKTASLIYKGLDGFPDGYKSLRGINDFVYSPGDQLRYTGFANNPSGITGSDVMEDAPVDSKEYLFEIIEGIPCPGIPTVTYEGQVYKTVQIGNQCWFKENLNAGTMIPGSQDSFNNNIIEKYCYDDNLANCSTYGGLYQWNEMMEYTSQEGTQGICPEGWHVPANAEWCTLTQFIDPTVNCNTTEWSGTDVGTKTKSTTSWNSGGNRTNESGFTALPGGGRAYVNSFTGQGIIARFWPSTESNTSNAWYWYLHYDSTQVRHLSSYKYLGLSVRCVQD